MRIAGKQERQAADCSLKSTVKAELGLRFEGREGEISGAYKALTKTIVRHRLRGFL